MSPAPVTTPGDNPTGIFFRCLHSAVTPDSDRDCHCQPLQPPREQGLAVHPVFILPRAGRGLGAPLAAQNKDKQMPGL